MHFNYIMTCQPIIKLNIVDATCISLKILARFLQDLARSDKITNLERFLQIRSFLQYSYKILARNTFSRFTSPARILQEVRLSARTFENWCFLPEYVRILQDMYFCSSMVMINYCSNSKSACHHIMVTEWLHWPYNWPSNDIYDHHDWSLCDIQLVQRLFSISWSRTSSLANFCKIWKHISMTHRLSYRFWQNQDFWAEPGKDDKISIPLLRANWKGKSRIHRISLFG